jgi:hypothetical protein
MQIQYIKLWISAHRDDVLIAVFWSVITFFAFTMVYLYVTNPGTVK